MNKKRGISPLIATILLIGFAIVLAGIFIRWGGDILERQQETSGTMVEKAASIKDVSYNIQRIRYDPDNKLISILIENEKYAQIEGFLFHVIGDSGTQSIEINEIVEGSHTKAITFEYDKNIVGIVLRVNVIPRVTIGEKTDYYSEVAKIGSALSGHIASPIESFNYSFFQPNFTKTGDIKAKDHCFVKESGKYHLFYTREINDQGWATDPNSDDFGHVVSDDLAKWEMKPPVVPVGSEGEWDSKNVWAPSITYYDGKYYMFYTGVTDNVAQRIGIATSSNLYTWIKDENNPVFECDLTWSEWDPGIGWAANCRDPMVMWDEDNNRWLMYFVAELDEDPDNPNEKLVVGIVSSTDFYNWNEIGYVDPGIPGNYESPQVIKKGDTYSLFLTANSKIYQLTSTDPASTTWNYDSQKNPIVDYGAASETIQFGNDWFLTYFANSPVNKVHIWRIYWTIDTEFYLGT